MIGGALLGAAVAGALIAATVVTGGAAAVAVAGLVAGGALAGGQLARGLQTVMGAQNPTTGTLAGGSPDVRVNGRPAMRARLDYAATCSGLFMTHHPPKPRMRIAEGSGTVRVNSQPAARVGDRLECSATVTQGSPDVFVGGAPEHVLDVFDNEATWTKVATAVGLLAVGGGAVVAALAGTAAIVGFAAVGVAGYGLNEGLGWVGDRLGPGWRDVLQGGAGIVGLVAGAPRGARALRSQATRRRVLANIEASRAARRASNFEVHLARNDQLRWGYGADEWRMVDVPKGTRVIGGLPGQSAYYTTPGDLAAAGNSRATLFQNLQVKPHPQFGYRPKVGVYEVVDDIRVPNGVVAANPDLGPGGASQYFVRRFGKQLRLVETVDLGD